MARRKSFSQILDQAERVSANPRANSYRIGRANIAADRYTDNIMRQRSFRGRGAYDKGYSRSTYMGLNAG